MKDYTLKHAALGILIASLTVLFGIAISELIKVISFRALITALIFIIVLIFGSITIFAFFIDRQKKNLTSEAQQYLKGDIKRIERAIEELNGSGMGKGAFTQDELMEKERSFEEGEIWVVTKDLANDEPAKGEYFPIIKQNLEKGDIIYRYFTPEDPTCKSRRDSIRLALIDYWEKSLFCRFLSEKSFELQIGKNIGFYLPHPRLQKENEAYVEIMLSKTIRWAKLDNELTAHLIGWLKEESEKYNKEVSN